MSLPYLLILFRGLLAPTMICTTYFYGQDSKYALVAMLVAGVLSDVFDGIIARQRNLSTETLRRWDSQIDVVFWVGVGTCAYLLHPHIFEAHAYGWLAIIGLEVGCYALSFFRFGKETCTHALLSKIWGLILMGNFISIIAFGTGVDWSLVTIVWGIVSQIDVVLILLLLPTWQHDIPSSYHAYLIRKGKTIRRNKLFNG